MATSEIVSAQSKLNALLIGRWHDIPWTLPSLLVKAGFSVDVITSSPWMQYSKFIRECNLVPSSESLIPAIAQKLKQEYDWIVITDDGSLTDILHSSLSLEDKLKALPVLGEENFCHLYSKIGLSKVFATHGIGTPAFSVVHSFEEALQEASCLGYPVLVKRDSSGGGEGVFECQTAEDFQKIPSAVFNAAVLVQKKIKGIELDLSAIYLRGDLVHFSYSKPEKVCGNRFGPSSLRMYHSLSVVDEKIFQELEQVGKTLGAHGFINISCMQHVDGSRYYFEADMRPNVWAQFSRFLGEDPSLRIHKWFVQKEVLKYPVNVLSGRPQSLRIPYFQRLKRWEFLMNRYKVWRFIPFEDRELVLRLIVDWVFVSQMKVVLSTLIKAVTPKKWHPFLKNLKKGMLKRFQI